MPLFEDTKMEYYRECDRQFDEQKAKAEDARMLAYERKKAELSGSPMQEAPSLPTTTLPQHYLQQQNSGANSVRRKAPKDDAWYSVIPLMKKPCQPQKTIKGNPPQRFHRTTLPDGTDCFEVTFCGTKTELRIKTTIFMHSATVWQGDMILLQGDMILL